MSNARLSLFEKFVSQLGKDQTLWNGYDYLSDVNFFVKDLESRVILANTTFFNRVGIERADRVLNGAEEELYPPDIYRSYVNDDHLVFDTGKPLENRIELNYDVQGRLDWFCTTKLPLFGKNGKVIGLQGITRRHLQQSRYEGLTTLNDVMRFVSMNLDKPLRLGDLSAACGVSIRQLSRDIQDAIGETPHRLVLRMRVSAASEALIQTDDSILAIAIRCGFPDQTTFGKAFRLRMGQTPKQYRNRFRPH